MPNDATPKAVRRNDDELAIVRAIAASGADRPITMLNLNRYAPAAAYPDGRLYRDYMSALLGLLPKVGGAVLWRTPVDGQAVGEQKIDEILAVWYPSCQAFLDLRSAPGADENFRLRAEAVAYAVIHRCPGDKPPLSP